MFKNISKEFPVIGWYSGGVTSAVACKLITDWFGKENVRLVFLDTRNEDSDTYRFMSECQDWTGVEIEYLANPNYTKIQEVWYKFKSLNVAHGAICSSELKRAMRYEFQRNNQFSYQAFGFDSSEIKRCRGMKLNYPESKPIFPLIYEILSKEDCIKILTDVGIDVPVTYQYGFNNNNCFQTGCVQGGIGYWQKMKRDFPDKFDAMAAVEHDLTNLKGEPVTMLKDQSKGGGLVFLKPHPNYPFIKDISMMKGRPPKPLFECNGFCGTNDFVENKTENEINYQMSLELLNV